MKLKRYYLLELILIIIAFLGIACGDNGTGPEKPQKPEIITSPEVKNIHTTSADITWETDVSSNSTVKYGTTSGQYGSTETKDIQEKIHTVKLERLQANTVYYFIVESENEGGKATSDENHFTTQMVFSELIDEAWVNYEKGEYLTAISQFQEAKQRRPDYADVYNGLGWCNATGDIDSLEKSLNYFDEAININENFSEAVAGRGFVHLALNQYMNCIIDLNKTLQLDYHFEFDHDIEINADDVRIGLAEAYFYRQNYSEVQTLVDALAPNNGLDPNDNTTWIVDDQQYDTYVEALLTWIEKLKTVIG